MEPFKVAAKSDPNKVAGALANTIRGDNRETVELQAIGAGALNQAVKAVIIARGYLAPSGVDLLIEAAFKDIEVRGEDRTAIRLTVHTR